mgnify:CR=1 FL=1
MKKSLLLLAASSMFVSHAWPEPLKAQSIFDTIREIKNIADGMKRKQDAPKAASNSIQNESANENYILSDSDPIADDLIETSLSEMPIQKTNPETFDILGLKLGMSPREVIKISKKNKIFRRGSPSTTGTFELEATRIANRSLSKPISTTSKVIISGASGLTQNGGEISLRFYNMPSGPILGEIKYKAKLNGQTWEGFKQSLASKYGNPTVSTKGYMENEFLAWCSSSAACRPNSITYTPKGPQLTVIDFGESIEFRLESGRQLYEAEQAALKARAAEIAAQRGGGVNF